MRTECPKCGCKEYTKQGKEKTKFKGVQELVLQERRKCKNCGCRYTVNPKIRNHPKCPFCGKSHTQKAGFSKFGAQKYKCTSCGKNFQVSSPTSRFYVRQERVAGVPLGTKFVIQSYSNNGFPIPYIQKFINLDKITIQKIITEAPKFKTKGLLGVERAILCSIQASRGIHSKSLVQNFCLSPAKIKYHLRRIRNEYPLKFSKESGYYLGESCEQA